MKNMIIKFIIIFIVCVILIFLGYKFNDNILFQYNIMDVLAGVFIAYGLYYLTKINEEKNNQNNKIENIIELIQKKINTVFDESINVENQQEYLHTFKYLDNKIKILRFMTKHLKCENEISIIMTEKDKIQDFVVDNLNEGNEYFIKANVKEKIPNIIENIETQLDNIIMKIYKF